MDENGEKAFTVQHKPMLRRLPHELIYKMAVPMFSSTSVEEHEGKLRANPFRFNLIVLAEKLGMTIAEIEKISVDEYNEWVAYLNIAEDMNKNGNR